jgi:hypothetical protein
LRWANDAKNQTSRKSNCPILSGVTTFLGAGTAAIDRQLSDAILDNAKIIEAVLNKAVKTKKAKVSS